MVTDKHPRTKLRLFQFQHARNQSITLKDYWFVVTTHLHVICEGHHTLPYCPHQVQLHQKHWQRYPDHTKHYRLSSPQAQARGVHRVTGDPDTVTTAYIKLSNYRTN